MENEAEWTAARIELYHLMKAHPDWGYRAYARELGRDPGWARKWCLRIRGAKTVSLNTFKGRSRAPKHTQPKITPEAKKLVVELREELSKKYHRSAGAKTILYGLEQQQKQQTLTFKVPKVLSTINRILRETGHIQPPKARSHEPLVLPDPMDEWELDFGEIPLEANEVFEFFIVVDRGTSRLIYLEGGQGYCAETALEAVARLLVQHGLPRRLRFDRDSRLWGAWTRDSYPSPLVRFLRAVGVEPVVCPPRRPDLKPFVERCIKTIKYEWFARLAPTTLAEAWDALEGFPHYYNDERPHQGHACQNQPPSVAFPVLPSLPALPETVHPDKWLDFAHSRIYRRRVTSDGTIQVDRHTYTVGSDYRKQQVLVQVDAKQTCFYISCEGQLVKQVPIKGVYGNPLTFQDYLKAMKVEARTIARRRQELWEQTGELL